MKNLLPHLSPIFLGRLIASKQSIQIESRGNVLIYDSIGLSALEDLPDQSIVVVRFVLIPDGTPRAPKNGLRFPLDLNSVTLKAGMANDELPLRGELNFVEGIGGSWKFNHDQCFVSIEMRRLKRVDGKAAGLPVLFELTYSFK